LASANQVLSEFIAADQVWYVSLPGKRPALLSEVGVFDTAHDGVCLFRGRQEALDFLRASDVLPGQFRPRRAVPHRRRPQGVGSFVRECRHYSDFLCLPWPAADGGRFVFYFLEIKQLLAAAREVHPPAVARPPFGDPLAEWVQQRVSSHQLFRFSDN
jgi:hypothetical protein